MVYRWALGAQIKADPQTAGEALDALQQAHRARLTARMVLDAGRPPDSALHPCFEWDDVRAAELHREDQARYILRSVRVVTSDGDKPILMRVFVNVIEDVNGEEQQNYITVAQVQSDADLLARVCEQASRDLRAWQNRYRSFEVLAAIGQQAIDSITALMPAPATTGREHGI